MHQTRRSSSSRKILSLCHFLSWVDTYTHTHTQCVSVCRRDDVLIRSVERLQVSWLPAHNNNNSSIVCCICFSLFFFFFFVQSNEACGKKENKNKTKVHNTVSRPVGPAYEFIWLACKKSDFPFVDWLFFFFSWRYVRAVRNNAAFFLTKTKQTRRTILYILMALCRRRRRRRRLRST